MNPCGRYCTAMFVRTGLITWRASGPPPRASKGILDQSRKLFGVKVVGEARAFRSTLEGDPERVTVGGGCAGDFRDLRLLNRTRSARDSRSTGHTDERAVRDRSGGDSGADVLRVDDVDALTVDRRGAGD